MDRAAETAATRSLALDFLAMAFIDGQFRRAIDTFVAEDFVQHNPHIADGWAGHRAFFGKMAEKLGDSSEWAHVTDMVLADGDLFAVMHHVFRSPDDHGQIVVDIWRVRDGKMVEHWDVIEQMPRGGIGPVAADDWTSAMAHRDSVEVPACGCPDPGADRAVSLACCEAHMAKVSGAAALSSPRRIVAEGDLVLAHYLAGGEARIEVFRVAEGRISERWEVRQPVPATSANGNGMW